VLPGHDDQAAEAWEKFQKTEKQAAKPARKRKSA
jgi:hypothetical protein